MKYLIHVLTFMEEGSAMKIRRIVTMARGSWKWQDAFRVAEYELCTAKNGKIVWRVCEYLTDKCSWPQLRRAGYTDLAIGGLHNKEISEKHFDK